MKTNITIFSDYTILENDIVSYDEDDQNQYLQFEDAVTASYLWDLNERSGTVPIPYVIDSRSTEELHEKIDAAISEFHQKTCIR